MTCADIRPLLPAHVYGDLSDADAAAVARHLRECSACRSESAALDQVRLALDTPPIAPIRVDVPALFHQVAERRACRWRRLAIAGAALAATMLLVFALRLQVAVANDQIVISWGNPASRERERPVAWQSSPPVADAPGLPSRLLDVDERIRLLQEFTTALAADIDARDRQRQLDADTLRARQDGFQRVILDRLTNAERMSSALYVAQFQRPEEKQNP